MRKQIKISLLLLGLAVLFCILHNAVYGLFGIEEPIFFSLTLLSALGFLISLVYNLFAYIKGLRKK